ncbi:uncharacterized protein LOC130768273 isoform X1 [Actinidia eriantha]|uniref:uncharacterized protein LOC130768273 isoform X1 n=1 Tax=Actinidia eriantha TaxID=165200 RepID=UPI00258A66F6|nr:uncharacterized protein LOC130768273 isoform X1 [Actinidia eriantha]
MSEEKSSEDLLPPGWTVEVRVRKNGKKDKCYTDPLNGFEFFSKPEVFRYLNNTETSHSKSKGKRKRSRKLSAINSSPVAEELKLDDGKEKRQVTGDQSSELAGDLKDEKSLESCTVAGMEGTSGSCVNLPEATYLEQREKSNPITGLIGLVCVSGNKRMQLGLNKLKNKKKPDLPRRASKRLAGIEVCPIPELKTNNRARRGSARQLHEAEASTAANLRASAAPDECAEKRDREDNTDEKRKRPIALPPENLSIPEEHMVQVETDKKPDKEPGSRLNLSMKDLWMDPCIEFAIKTLTGGIPIEEEHKADENPGSSLELPFGDSWGDPCIEFAVKTLTGAIPLVDDLGIEDYLQQQLTSLGTKGDKGSNS